MQSFVFSHPWVLFNLLWVPLWLWYSMGVWHAKSFIPHGSVHIFSGTSAHPHRVPLLLRACTLTCLIGALARPQMIIEHVNSSSSGIDMILALDLSTSMLIPDFSINQLRRTTRIDAAKEVLKGFIYKRKHDRIGLVSFARYPYLVSPLTLNHNWLLKNLERLNAGIIEDGTAIGSAITMSVNRLKDLTAKTRLIIILTDGVNNFGDVSPLLAAEVAQGFQIKIYTIMVGNDQVFPVDEQTLVQMAEKTGGLFYRAYDYQTLQGIYKEIDQLEKSSVTLEGFKTYTEFFPWLLALAGLFLALEFFLKNYRYRILS